MPQDTVATTARRNRAKRIIAGHTDKLKVVGNQLKQAREAVAVGGGGKQAATARVDKLLARQKTLNEQLRAARQFA